MDLSQWFHEQLQTSADGFAWAVEQVPTERRYALPPLPLGTWSAVRHAFHMFFYERTFALPSMRQWLGGPRPDVFGLSEEAAWADGPARGSDPDLDGLLASFREVRAEQVVLLSEFDGSAWDEARSTLWGPVTLRWVVTKTCQHTAEHTHDVLSLVLYWDMAG
jgi:hypothetical protein